ncbi:MAG TPA: hypothetical protein VFY71_09580 [Planctomycetota bacterium]|nr:hypothetical protein [Planctomycetota bacterium]
MMRAARLALGLLALSGPVLAQTIAAPPAAATPLPRVVLPDQSRATFHRDGLHSVLMLFLHRPTLVVSWRADDPAGARRLVPAALALADSFQGDLALLLVERSGLSYTDMLRFAAREHWLGGTAAWTCEVPSGLAALPTPSFVLISAKQATLLAGDPLAQQAELAAAAKRLVDERRNGGPGAPGQTRDALTALSAGNLAKALSLVSAPYDEATARTLQGPAQLVADEILNQYEWCNEMLLVGLGAAARPRVEALGKALSSLPRDDDWRRQADDALDVYTCGDQNMELKASAAMLDLQAQLFRDGPSGGLWKSLQKMAKAHAGTHAAERAAFLATIASP